MNNVGVAGRIGNAVTNLGTWGGSWGMCLGSAMPGTAINMSAIWALAEMPVQINGKTTMGKATHSLGEGRGWEQWGRYRLCLRSGHGILGFGTPVH